MKCLQPSWNLWNLARSFWESRKPEILPRILNLWNSDLRICILWIVNPCVEVMNRQRALWYLYSMNCKLWSVTILIKVVDVCHVPAHMFYEIIFYNSFCSLWTTYNSCRLQFCILCSWAHRRHKSINGICVMNLYMMLVVCYQMMLLCSVEAYWLNAHLVIYTDA